MSCQNVPVEKCDKVPRQVCSREGKEDKEDEESEATENAEESGSEDLTELFAGFTDGQDLSDGEDVQVVLPAKSCVKVTRPRCKREKATKCEQVPAKKCQTVERKVCQKAKPRQPECKTICQMSYECKVCT